jgi:hypothetical protein
MPRRRSPLEANLPVPDDFVKLAKLWRSDAVDILLDFIWRALDRLKLLGFQFDPKQENLEREITQLLEPEIREVMTGAEPYFIQHGPFESETRAPAPAQPPQYDLGFILRDNRRAIWPIEAKVLKSDGAVAEYVKDVRAAFLTATYAPFSSEAAMLGYLLGGSPARALARISETLPCTMEQHPRFLDRDHRLSRHTRTIPPGKPYPVEFICHHVISLLQNENK